MKMITKTLTAGVLTALFAGHAYAQPLYGGALSFSDKTAQIKLYQTQQYASLDTEVGGSFFYTTGADKMAYIYASAMRPHVRGFYPLSIGVVPKLAYVQHDAATGDESGVSLMLGLKAALRFERGMPFVLSGTFAYGPEIFSNGDVTGMKSATLKGAAEIGPQVSLFMEYGYTQVDFKTAGNDYTLDDALRAGISFAF